MKSNYFRPDKLLFIFCFCLLLANSRLQAQVTVTYTFTGAMQTFTVPSCVSTVSADVRGAQGGGVSLAPGGLGGRAQAVMTVTTGEVLEIWVGGAGGYGISTAPNGGFNGGAGFINMYPTTTLGGGGGGASDIRRGSGLNNRIIVGGGGGGGSNSGIPSTNNRLGGAGGGLTGGTGGIWPSWPNSGGVGGNQAAGGAAGVACCQVPQPGTFGNGGIGDGDAAAGCGGGGGWYGGGGGLFGGGGGGSSYLGYPGHTNTVTTSGFQSGNGVIILSYDFNGAGVSATASSSAICSGNTATLTASNVLSYTWTPGGSNATSITVSPTSNTSYTVEGLNSFGCVSKSILTLTVDAGIPTLTVTNTANSGGICPTRTVNLTATGATSYTWAGGSPAVTNGITFSPTATYDYTVTGGNACGTSSAVTSVSIHPFPTVTPFASSSTLCAGGSLTLTATGNATNYVWSGGSAPSGNGVGFVPPASTVTYSVIGTSALSCTALATVPVTVHATPNQLPSASPTLICLGNSSTLTASGALSYTWASSTQTVYTSAFTVTPASSGVTTYTVTKANSTCADTRTIGVTVNALPLIFAIASPPTVCALQPSTLSIGGGISYTWTAPGPPSYTFTGASPVVYPQNSPEYTVAASDGTCIAKTTISVTTNLNPTITVSPNSPSICIGHQVSITANGGNSYTWTAGTNTFYTATITDSPTTAIAYNVTGDNASGCTATAQQIILVYPLPPTTASSGKALACNEGSVILTAGGAHSYTWDANAGGAISPTVVVYPSVPASGLVIYTVTGSFTTTGCAFSKTVQVSVYVPSLSVNGATNACAGGQISLSASGGNANTYSWNTGSGTFNFPSVTTTLSSASVFTVSATSTSLSATCPVTKTVAVGIYPNPNITATAERSVICPKESTQLFAGGGASYSWSNAMSGGTITVSPLAQTNNYVVTGTDGNGCVNTATVQVKLQNCTGIEEQNGSSSAIKIYPNPNNGEFVIGTTTEMDLVLSNELGQMIKIIHVTANTDNKITGLSKGVYFIAGQKNEIKINQKIIVVN